MTFGGKPDPVKRDKMYFESSLPRRSRGSSTPPGPLVLQPRPGRSATSACSWLASTTSTISIYKAIEIDAKPISEGLHTMLLASSLSGIFHASKMKRSWTRFRQANSLYSSCGPDAPVKVLSSVRPPPTENVGAGRTAASFTDTQNTSRSIRCPRVFVHPPGLEPGTH